MASHILIPVFRTVLMYFLIYLTLRIMGKREIGKLSIFDLVISIMIAEIGVFVLEDIKRPIYDGIFPMATLVIIQITIAFISLKSRKARLLFEGKPSILVSGGKLHRSEMKKQRYNLDDLLLQLRGQNIENIADVEFAILENSGQLTVIPKSQSASSPGPSEGLFGGQNSPSRQQTSPSQRQPHTMLGLKAKGNIANSGGQAQAQESTNSSSTTKSRTNKKILVPAGKFSYGVLPVPLIMDGKVQDDNLQRLKKNRFWLKNQIQEQGVKDFKDVFLCSIDHKGKVYVDRK
ncbi:YetF domain-containing protein [Paenibacillus sp. SAF-054]|uniref:YetF domain-containing protein n=1 Tax=unclassified Paenibacillus TaxID=185978 RepID=UPI003F7DA91F